VDQYSGNFRSAPEIPCCPFRKRDSCVKRLLSLSSEVLFAHHKAEIKKRRPIIKAAKSQRRAISTPSISNPQIPPCPGNGWTVDEISVRGRGCRPDRISLTPQPALPTRKQRFFGRQRYTNLVEKSIITIVRGSSVAEVGRLPRRYCLDANFGHCTKRQCTMRLEPRSNRDRGHRGMTRSPSI
jgi:hypothetical protein